ncbi:unnamed protein product [Nesidiocoris tenuis]|uniref:DH domain-containing protein n=1 Tax=Nesidiocoris tenuis TaxID=355587 RepID=A0A6H5GWY6_9HEMI|nr:unnamed protein product [Nesidiocoris tenuis]
MFKSDAAVSNIRCRLPGSSMARIIGAERAAAVHNDTGGTGNARGGGDSSGMRPGGGSGRISGGRKPSFKTRGPGGSAYGQHNRNIRATKVTLPASKINRNQFAEQCLPAIFRLGRQTTPDARARRITTDERPGIPERCHLLWRERESEGIYGLMMSAGKKVKKTSWSISQRLRRRMSKISIAVTNGNEPAENGEDNQMRWPSFKKKSKSGTSKFYLDAAPSPHEPASLQPSPSDSGLPTPLSLPLVLPAVPASKEPPRRPSPPLSAPDPRRLSTAFATAPRPTSPPPPPPPLVNGEGKGTSKVNDHTLYVESGLFDHTHPPSPQQLAANQTNQSSNETSNGFLSNKNHSNSQWYSDAGLYENTTADPNSGHGSQLDLQFADEPLYQFYAARVAELEQRENNSDIGYEEIGPNSDLSDREIYSPSDISVGSVGSGGVRPSAMDLVSPESIHRTLWCQVPQVINSGILESLTPNQKRLQEAKFELITSEASYYKSLSVLEKVFANSSAFKDETIIPKVDYKTIFGNIIPVRKCSEALLAGMEKCWQDSILLDGICDILLSVTKEKFSAYVRYCSHQVAIERTLKRLKKNPIFAEKLSNLESSPACHSLSLSSFLLLPMQRVTRLPLLLDAIMTKLESGSSEFESCQAALLAINKVVYDCNEAARQTERLEEMVALSRALTFPKHLRPLPLMSASRYEILVEIPSPQKMRFISDWPGMLTIDFVPGGLSGLGKWCSIIRIRN